LTEPDERAEVIVIGGGQAGLAVSYYLRQQARAFVIIEQTQLGEAWLTGRWDSFCMITPNARTFTLPGLPYGGDDPEGFAPLREIQAYIQQYVAMLDPPAHVGVRATSLRRCSDGEYLVETTAGIVAAPNVVVATGLLQQPKVPLFAAQLPGDVHQIHSSDYRNPTTLPRGNVLVVGSGQSGCPIAEELNTTGRKVFLSVGNTGRAPSRYRGRAKTAWVPAIGLPVFAADGLAKGGLASDPGGGRDYSPHRFARDGVTLLGHLTGVRGSSVVVAPDLYDLLRASDRLDADFKREVDEYILREGLDAPEDVPAETIDDGYRQEQIAELDLHAAGITSIVWCTGYAFDFSWIDVPVFDHTGYPLHDRGVTASPGLYFVGMHWRSRPVSAFVGGVSGEAEHIAANIATRAALVATSPTSRLECVVQIEPVDVDVCPQTRATPEMQKPP
jgi:putative flavoprotein involved in K+ transport